MTQKTEVLDKNKIRIDFTLKITIKSNGYDLFVMNGLNFAC